MLKDRAVAGLCRSPIAFIQAYLAHDVGTLRRSAKRRAIFANTKLIESRQWIFVFMEMRALLQGIAAKAV